jgi:hypothetical protein
MNKHKIVEWFFNNFENILDEATSMCDLKEDILNSNDEEFHEEIEHQSLDEYTRSICITCSSNLGLPYDEVYDTLESKLEEIFYAIGS